MKNIIRTIVLFSILCSCSLGFAHNNLPIDKHLQHVLLFKWADGHIVETKAKVLNLFKGLPEKIEGLVSFEIRDVISSSGDFDNILIFKFKSEDGLEEYEDHPDHLKVKELAPSLLSGFAAFDYWQ